MGASTVGEGTASVPVLVLGSTLTALAVVRNLGRARIPAFVASETEGYVARSRWYRALPTRIVECPDPRPLAAFLARLPFERAVLMPCTDTWATAVAALPPSVAVRFPSSIAPSDAIGALVDKACFAHTLRSLGLPHPRTIQVEKAGDLEALPPEVLQDSFLKPTNSQAFGRRFSVKAFRVKSLAEATARLLEVQQAGLSVMLQEYVPGPATAHYFVEGFIDRAGGVCARFGRRRLRIYPPEFGNSSAAVSVPLSELGTATEAVDRLLAALRYRGVFQAEVKYDHRDDTFKILEVNSRMHTWVEFQAACGVDFCALAYRDALELPIRPLTEFQVGRRAIWLPHDFEACRGLHRAGQLTLWAWLRSWLGARQLMFCWDDPVPAVVALRDARRERSRR